MLPDNITGMTFRDAKLGLKMINTLPVAGGAYQFPSPARTGSPSMARGGRRWRWCRPGAASGGEMLFHAWTLRCGSNATYPNFGDDLHKAAARNAADANLGVLAGLATPKRLQNDQFDAKPAYILAGSFVRFLIESHGMQKFRELYALTPLVSRQRNPGARSRWQAVYGIGFDALAAAWRSMVG